MRAIFTFLFLSSFVGFTSAQTIVSTNPENKKAVLEEFTGTGCPNCPGGHTAAANILSANPRNVIVIAYHPTNSSYTASDPMAKAYASAFYTTPFISASSRYMPSAIINRRKWSGGDRIQGVSAWAGHVTTIMGESSPLNVGVTSSYNEGTKILSVSAEVFFTANVTNTMTIYCMITQDGIIASQSGGTDPYTHNHVFREALVAQWGDPVTGASTQGTLKTFSFTFDNNSASYDMTKCEVVVMIRNADDEEIISGNVAPVNETSPISVQERELSEMDVAIYPNPTDDRSTIDISLSSANRVRIKVTDMAGKIISYNDYGILEAGRHDIQIDPVVLKTAGIYLVSVESGNNHIVRKIVVR